MANRSVVATLQAAGLYKESGRMAEQTLVTILPNNERAEHKMAEVDYADIKTLADELDIALAHMNPIIQELYAKNAAAIVNAMRVVNVESASGFKGAVGSGRQLDTILLRPEQFQNPAAAGVAVRTTWLRNILAAPQTCQIICAQDALGIDTHGDLTMAITEALLIFGFANPSWTPVSTAIQPNYLGQAFNVQWCAYDLVQPFTETPLIELKEPFILYPRENGNITVRYSVNGADELQPIGLWVKMAQNLRAIATS
jgi:hypothetical protein